MKDMTCFNAATMLKGLDLEASHPIVRPKNYVTIGAVTKFYATDLMGKWGHESYPLVKSDQGVIFDSPFIASAMIRSEGIVLNADMDPVFHCMHTPRSAKEAGLPHYDFVQRHLNWANGSFPKLVFYSRYPVAIRREDLINFDNPTINAVYLQKLGVRLTDLTCEYVPSYKTSQHGGICSVWSVIVELI